MPLYLVSCEAVVHARIRAPDAETAGREFIGWRQTAGGEVPQAGGYVLLRLDTPVQVIDAAGKPQGEIRGGRHWYPTTGSPREEQSHGQ